jgi:hypothetical protein
METAIVNISGTVQLIGLAVLLVIVLVLGARIAGSGPKGFASAIIEVGAVLVALWFIARPNDVLNLLLRAVGGIQAPTLPS